MVREDSARTGRHFVRAQRAVASLLAASTAATGFFLLARPAAAATPTGAACAAATTAAQVHYLAGLSASVPSDTAIAGLTIDGFDSSHCDGLPVRVTIRGNTAGSDAAAADELLSTLDSRLDPCSGAKLGAPVIISGGSITLNGCAGVLDPTRAAYASMHDATQLSVDVADIAIAAVIGAATTSTPPASSAPSSTPRSSVSDAGSGASSSHDVAGVSASRSAGSTGQASGQHDLAGTGVDIALLIAGGLVLILCGWLLLLRRRRSAHGH